MPEDDNDETLHIQGMRPLPEGQPFGIEEVVAVPTEQPAVSTKRGPRRQKATVTTAKRRGRAEKTAPNHGTSAGDNQKDRSKRARPKTFPNAGERNSPRESSALDDEFAEFTQLDEENKRLRKMLGDKLRQENAELRERLQIN